MGSSPIRVTKTGDCACGRKRKDVQNARPFSFSPSGLSPARFANGKTTQCSSVFCVNLPLFVTGLFALKQVVVPGTKFDGFSFFAMPFGTLTTNFCFFNDVVYGSMQAMLCKTLLFFALLW